MATKTTMTPNKPKLDAEATLYSSMQNIANQPIKSAADAKKAEQEKMNVMNTYYNGLNANATPSVVPVKAPVKTPTTSANANATTNMTLKNDLAVGQVDTRPATNPNAIVKPATTQTQAQANNGINSFMDAYLKQLSGYRNEQQANAEAAFNRALETSNTNYNASVDRLNSQNDEALRQAYIANMLSQKNLQDRLASAGISGGASETTMANANNTYLGNRNQLEQTLNDNLRDLSMSHNNDIAGISDTYLNNISNINSDYYKSLADYQKDINAMLNSANDVDKERAWQSLEAEKNRALTERENALDRLQQMEVLEREYGLKADEAEKQRLWQTAQNALDREQQMNYLLQQQSFQGEQNALDRELTSSESDKKYSWQSGENALDRDLDWNKVLNSNEQNALDRDLDWNKVLNSNEQNALDWANKFKYLTQQQTFEGGENELDRELQRYLKGLTANGTSTAQANVNNTNTTVTTPDVTPETTPTVIPTVTPSRPAATEEKEQIAQNAAESGVGTTAAEAKRALAESQDHYDNAYAQAAGIWKNSGGNVNAVSNTLEGMVNNGYITENVYNRILASILSQS